MEDMTEQAIHITECVLIGKTTVNLHTLGLNKT